jgi:carbonic anhydrase
MSITIEKIFEQNKLWIARKLEHEQDYFKNLAKGQSPEVLYIGCSDSRVTGEELMGAKPGEIFVHRNIANMVVSVDLNAMSVINYAVKHLKVKHVVICGHYECGGVKAAMSSTDLGILNPWLRNIRDVYRIHANELDVIQDERTRYNRLIELNVFEQCVNLCKTEVIQEAILKNGVTVHGWVFDIKTGELIDLSIDYKMVLENIMKIYKIV